MSVRVVPSPNYYDLLEVRDAVWLDDCGVPRFVDPDPSLANEPDADEVVFAKVRCLDCGRELLVARATSYYRRTVYSEPRLTTELDRVQWKYPRYLPGHRAYGDNPVCLCHGVGGKTVVQALWKKEGLDWVQDTEYTGRVVKW